MLRNLAGRLVFRLFMTARVLWSPTAFGVTGAVFDDAGRILLVRHRYKPGWSLPSGGVDRAEPPADAVLRELREEVGLTGGTAQFAGLYTRGAGWASNVIALYRITGGQVNFRPSLEICEIVFADPHDLPTGVTDATRRRLTELSGSTPAALYW